MFHNVGEHLGFLRAISRAISSTLYTPPLANPQDLSDVIIESAFPAIVTIVKKIQSGNTPSDLALQNSIEVGGSHPKTSEAEGREAGYQRPLSLLLLKVKFIVKQEILTPLIQQI